MYEQANVQSLTALKELRAALILFAETATLILEEANSDVRRTRTWLQNDALRFWKKKAFLCQEEYVRTKVALSGRLAFERSVQGVPSSCVDERKALKKASERLEHAQKKLAAVHGWLPQLDKVHLEYRSRTQGLNTALTMDLPKAWARLDKMSESLEAYVALTPPESSGTAKTSQDADTLPSVLRPASQPQEEPKELEPKDTGESS
ncbi:MAG: hypothetical protein HQ515_17255 [Phycisphaeraceae bacterium]|nr:hypothetical protein [Phycisphaeraceae bacterium]